MHVVPPFDQATTAELVTSSAEETARAGAELAPLLRPGDVVPLWGEFGVGKTTFVQGVARGLGIAHPVVSPSFGLIHPYVAPSGLTLYHLDLYRVRSVEEAEAFGVEEVLAGDGLCLVEWPRVIEPILPADRLDLAFDLQGEDVRRLTLVPRGSRSAELLRAFLEILRATPTAG